ncbi:MAG: hypothetical protein JO301_10060 [Chitinophagaceae bacterium]|nr:hypothetical protein [Chitinophagaceae bacterium]
MRSYILLSEKQWHDELFMQLKDSIGGNWYRISDKAEFNLTRLNELHPDKIFIPHWSYIIPAEIFEKYECIVFHMTDLPFGRGGSPLQNLIALGHESTKISALRVVRGIDEGDIYCKRDLDLSGTAKEIFLRSVPEIASMIKEIIQEEPRPVPQRGDVVKFKRRAPSDSNVGQLKEIKELYNFIRMLDCEGYPNAFIENEHFRFEFTAGKIEDPNTISADVRIIKK